MRKLRPLTSRPPLRSPAPLGRSKPSPEVVVPVYPAVLKPDTHEFIPPAEPTAEGNAGFSANWLAGLAASNPGERITRGSFVDGVFTSEEDAKEQAFRDEQESLAQSVRDADRITGLRGLGGRRK